MHTMNNTLHRRTQTMHILQTYKIDPDTGAVYRRETGEPFPMPTIQTAENGTTIVHDLFLPDFSINPREFAWILYYKRSPRYDVDFRRTHYTYTDMEVQLSPVDAPSLVGQPLRNLYAKDNLVELSPSVRKNLRNEQLLMAKIRDARVLKVQERGARGLRKALPFYSEDKRARGLHGVHYKDREDQARIAMFLHRFLKWEKDAQSLHDVNRKIVKGLYKKTCEEFDFQEYNKLSDDITAVYTDWLAHRYTKWAGAKAEHERAFLENLLMFAKHVFNGWGDVGDIRNGDNRVYLSRAYAASCRLKNCIRAEDHYFKKMRSTRMTHAVDDEEEQ